MKALTGTNRARRRQRAGEASPVGAAEGRHGEPGVGERLVEGADADAGLNGETLLSMEWPTMRFDHASLTAHRYSVPSAVRCSVMSASHSRFGPSGLGHSNIRPRPPTGQAISDVT
jgi:hypothetical protein